MVETGGLENRLALTGYGGSNPSPSAINVYTALCVRGSNPSPSAISLLCELAIPFPHLLNADSTAVAGTCDCS